MADNHLVKDGNGSNLTLRSTDNAGVFTPHTNANLRVADADVNNGNPVPVNGPLTDTQLRLSPVPVSVSGGATAANQTTGNTVLSSLDTKTPALGTATPNSNAAAAPTRPVGQTLWVCSFANSGASVLSADFTTPVVGTGVTYNQTSGSLNILTGTTTNAEFLTRSTVSWRGAMRMRASIVASQRIANQNLQITLADLIGSALAYTIVSTTVVNVTLTAHGYTTQNVGQFMNLGGITGAAGVPGRYAIAAIVDVNTIQFTVAGWPASGSGTLTLFGYNYHRNLINGVTATNIAYDAQRRGWASGDTTATINTTASPGTIVQNDVNGRDAFLMDQLRATSTTPTFTTRASRYENIPDDDVPLFLWLWSYNGTVAPASTTTWTLGFVSVESFANTPVFIQGARANGAANAFPVSVQGTATVAGTVTANIGTGSIAAGTNAIGDVGQQYRASATGAASRTHLVSAASTNATIVKASAGRLLGWALGNTNAAWRYVKLHNQTTTPTAGAGVVQTIAIPPNGLAQMKLEGGIAFTTGIALTTVTGAVDSDVAAVGANDIVGDVFFA